MKKGKGRGWHGDSRRHAMAGSKGGKQSAKNRAARRKKTM